jgi:hypothetical protein
MELTPFDKVMEEIRMRLQPAMLNLFHELLKLKALCA